MVLGNENFFNLLRDGHMHRNPFFVGGKVQAIARETRNDKPVHHR